MIAAIYWRLSRAGTPTPSLGASLRAISIGALLIFAAVGVLIWSSLYRHDLWRPYLYIPIGASVAVFSAIVLVTAVDPVPGRRRLTVIIICLLFMFPALSRLQAQLSGFVESANRKAAILRDIIEIAPSLAPMTQIQLRTDISYQEMRSLGIGEFLNGGMIDSAMYVLYAGQGPEYTYFCVSNDNCSVYEGEITAMTAAPRDEILQRTLVFQLNRDLAVGLIAEPGPSLGIDTDLPYDASRLFDSDAPLPPRAYTMLAAAK